MSNYWRYSRSAYYSAEAALPLLVIYEIFIVLVNQGTGESETLPMYGYVLF